MSKVLNTTGEDNTEFSFTVAVRASMFIVECGCHILEASKWIMEIYTDHRFASGWRAGWCTNVYGVTSLQTFNIVSQNNHSFCSYCSRTPYVNYHLFNTEWAFNYNFLNVWIIRASVVAKKAGLWCLNIVSVSLLNTVWPPFKILDYICGVSRFITWASRVLNFSKKEGGGGW